MPQSLEPGDLTHEVAELQERVAALREAASAAPSDPRSMLDAAFAELEMACATLDAAMGRLASSADVVIERPVADLERRLLRAVFQDAPVPFFLLERDGVVRRVNRQAAALLGTLPGYATGKPFPVFVDLATRAAVRTQIAALVRTGRRRRVRARLLGTGGPVDAVLSLELVEVPGEQQPLVVAVAGPTTLPVQPIEPPAEGAAGGRDGDDAIARVTQRLDLVLAANRLLLENSSFSEPMTLQRCARLLAAELAGWVLVDVAAAAGSMPTPRLRRQFVIGPADERSAEVARSLEELDPAPGTLPWQVHESAQSLLLAHIEDEGGLGETRSGARVLTQLGATSLVSVPLYDGEVSLGVITLVRHGEQGAFDLAELALVEELGEHIALALRIDRMFRRRSEVVDSLQTSLLPRALPQVPGIEIAATYLGATDGLEVGGDFYDVFDSPGGWGLVIGDVCGKGEEAAAATAMARYAIRVLAHWNPRPGEVLEMANEALRAQPAVDRYVTASCAYAEWQGNTLRMTVGCAGHPPPVLIRPDGRVRTLSGGGLPLGLFPDAEPSTEEVLLEPGDVVFFHSDGVTDARSQDERYFEDVLIERLAGLGGQPAANVVAGIQSHLVEFTGNDLRDDVSMLVVRVVGKPELD